MLLARHYQQPATEIHKQSLYSYYLLVEQQAKEIQAHNKSNGR